MQNKSETGNLKTGTRTNIKKKFIHNDCNCKTLKYVVGTWDENGQLNLMVGETRSVHSFDARKIRQKGRWLSE